MNVNSNKYEYQDNYPTVFVGGPIQHAITNGCFDINLHKILTDIFKIFQFANYEVLSAHIAEKFENATPELESSHITIRDYRWMEVCDVFVAVLPLKISLEPFRSDGTHIELGWASCMKKPVVVIAENPLSDGYSHLLRGLGELTSIEVLSATEVMKTPDLVLRASNKFLSLGKVQESCSGRQNHQPPDGLVSGGQSFTGKL